MNDIVWDTCSLLGFLLNSKKKNQPQVLLKGSQTFYIFAFQQSFGLGLDEDYTIANFELPETYIIQFIFICNIHIKIYTAEVTLKCI